jgi:hypothetical protein
MCMLKRDDITPLLRAHFVVKLQIFRLINILCLLRAVVAIAVFFFFPRRRLLTVKGLFTGIVEVDHATHATTDLSGYLHTAMHFIL